MQYIVLDMEWNQPWPGSYAAQKVLPVQIHGEIIQIGAVRLLETGKIADEFQVLVRPKYYKKLNSRVSKLTGLRDARLREEGLSFPEALERFRDWIGGPCIFLTWGFDDITVLEDNILLHDGEPDWITQWYNAQMIFNAQTGCGNTQKALSTAMELLGIEPSRPAHDALGDAYHTAIICSRLDLPRGIAEYKQALQSHADGFHGDPPAGCISRSVFHGYATREAAIEAMTSRENHCPKCGKSMRNGRWISQQGHRYMAMAECPEHGRYLVRIRISDEPGGTQRASRLVYEGNSEAAGDTGNGAGDLGQQLFAGRQRRDGLHLSGGHLLAFHQATLDLKVLVGLGERLHGLGGRGDVVAGEHERARAGKHVVERGQVRLLQSDVHERVLVHLQARTGFANSRAQGLDVLHGKTAVVHDPHGGNAI